jgi:hypothetical protein
MPTHNLDYTGWVWLILSWVQKCALLVAAMDSRKLRKAA